MISFNSGDAGVPQSRKHMPSFISVFYFNHLRKKIIEKTGKVNQLNYESKWPRKLAKLNVCRIGNKYGLIFVLTAEKF